MLAACPMHQVFDSSAVFLRSISVERPWQVSVHKRTGEIYVLNTDSLMPTSKTGTRISKYSSTGNILAHVEFQGHYDYNNQLCTQFALDESEDTAILWISSPTIDNSDGGIWRVAEFGNEFKMLGEVTQTGSFNNKNMQTDPQDQWLYINKARFNTRTGVNDSDFTRRLLNWPNNVTEICYGNDNLLYCRTQWQGNGEAKEYVARFNTETGALVPFASGLDSGRIAFSGYETFGYPRSGFDVAPNGDVYVIQDKKQEPVPDPTPFVPESWCMSSVGGPYFLNQYDNDGQILHMDKLPGISTGTGGVRIMRSKDIIIPMQLRQKTFNGLISDMLGGAAIPDLPSNFNSICYEWGSVCRFDADNGKIMMDDGGNWTGYTAQKFNVEGLKAHVEGVGPVPYSNGCICNRCRVDLDGFDRVFAPYFALSSVMALDANFNQIARIGYYGTADDTANGKTPLCRPHYVCVNDSSLYVSDPVNQTITRIALSYANQRTFNLDGTLYTAIEDGEPISQAALYQNTPNPFNPQTVIRYYLPKQATVTLRLYDVRGTLVKTIASSVKKAGVQSVLFDAGTLASGVYVYELKAGTFVSRKTMALIR